MKRAARRNPLLLTAVVPMDIVEPSWQVFRPGGCAAGEVSEWSKEAVLKTVEPQGSGGSNPSLSGNGPHADREVDEERCESGRIGRPAKALYLSRVPWVRIPPSPLACAHSSAG